MTIKMEEKYKDRKDNLTTQLAEAKNLDGGKDAVQKLETLIDGTKEGLEKLKNAFMKSEQTKEAAILELKLFDETCPVTDAQSKKAEEDNLVRELGALQTATDTPRSVLQTLQRRLLEARKEYTKAYEAAIDREDLQMKCDDAQKESAC